jgi:hypothetical protein
VVSPKWSSLQRVGVDAVGFFVGDQDSHVGISS